MGRHISTFRLTGDNEGKTTRILNYGFVEGEFTTDTKTADKIERVLCRFYGVERIDTVADDGSIDNAPTTSSLAKEVTKGDAPKAPAAKAPEAPAKPAAAAPAADDKK